MLANTLAALAGAATPFVVVALLRLRRRRGFERVWASWNAADLEATTDD